jgi:hypothetical protein
VHVTSDPAAITSDSGLNGMLVHYSSAKSEGVLAAFVHDGNGVDQLI